MNILALENPRKELDGKDFKGEKESIVINLFIKWMNATVNYKLGMKKKGNQMKNDGLEGVIIILFV